MSEIYAAIPKIMAEIGAIGKDKTNEQQHFKYRGVDDVMNALQPLLYKYGVFIVPEVMEHIREERQSAKGNNLIYSVCTIRYTFYANDGSTISAVVVGEGMDSGDKATNKAMAIAFKYACFQVFCIPTEEMKDPDAESPEVKAKVPAKTTVQEVPPPAAEPQAPPKPKFISKEQSEYLVKIAKAKWGDDVKEKFVKYSGYEKSIPESEFENVKQKLLDAPM